MPTIVEKLASRGYWRVEVRPTEYVEQRFESIKDVRAAIEKARVELRGWDFPHVPNDWGLPESQKWVGVQEDWHLYVQTWRAFKSGQFVYRGGVWVDWLDQDAFTRSAEQWKPRTRMPIVDALWSLTEFIEFGARWSQTQPAADSMSLSISFHGLMGRELFGDHEGRRWFYTYGPAKLDTFEFIRTLSQTELITNARPLAIAASTELFHTFGYTPGDSVLETIQAELFSKRGGSL